MLKFPAGGFPFFAEQLHQYSQCRYSGFPPFALRLWNILRFSHVLHFLDKQPQEFRRQFGDIRVLFCFVDEMGCIGF